MTHSFKLSRRIARFRAPVGAALLLSLFACNSADTFNPDRSTTGDPVDQGPALTDSGEVQAVPVAPSEAAISFAGGIPIGTFALPNSEFGSRYNGALRNIWPAQLVSQLSTIRSRGGRIVLMMAGTQKHYLNADGTFSLTKWKARVDRFKGIDLAGYISDGTLAGHYLLDEPNDRANWNGTTVSPSTLDEMARYSKQRWPRLATIVRTRPAYFQRSPRYVDAAWATYLSRHGSVKEFIRKNVADAQRRDLALVVGLNVLRGGTPNGTKMTASQVESWGSALLSSSYPCGFFSWTYHDRYLSSRSIKSAMKTLRHKAESRARKSCRS
jgi:hypothetical protein